MIVSILALVAGIIGVMLIVLAVVAMTQAELHESAPRKHLSFPRRRYLRKKARQANVY